MKNLRSYRLTRLTAAIGVLLIGALACQPDGRDVVIVPEYMPPLAKVEDRGTAFVPISQKFKIAILTFVDQTGKADAHTDPLADMLTTELDNTRRFALFDRADLRGGTTKTHKTVSEAGVQGTGISEEHGSRKTEDQKRAVEGKVDGVLLGYITSFNVEDNGTRGTMTIDYRIVNTAAAQFESNFDDKGLRDLIVASGTGEVKFVTNADQTALDIDRASVDAIARKIEQDFAKKWEATHDVEVKKVEGRLVTINVGEEHNIRPGFVGFIVRETDIGTLDYLAMFTIINIFPQASVGFVLTDSSSLSHVRIGSHVQLK